MNSKLSSFRYGKIGELDRQFDLKFWQAATSSERFKAAWELVVYAHKRKGLKEDELRLQRAIATFQRFPA